MQKAVYKEAVIREIGQETYDKQVSILKKLSEKKEKEGAIEDIRDIIDKRTEREKGAKKLHKGYEIFCGIKGNKLSGG